MSAEREPQPVLAAHLFAERAAREVVARVRPRRRIPEDALVVGGRGIEQREQPLAPLPARIRLWRDLVVLERNVEPIREPLDRADEVELLRVADERDQVALRAAAEAVVELLERVDGEARRPLLVERAPAGVTRACLS